ncbi:hypothetical protein ACFL18_02770 [Patescibacteria group bacterium]
MPRSIRLKKAKIVAIVISIGLIASAVGVYGFFRYQNSPQGQLRQETRTSGVKARDNLKYIDDAVEAIGEQEEEIDEQALLRLRAQVKSRAGAILRKNPCDMIINDIQDALQVAQDARRAGMNEEIDQILDWIKDGIRAMAGSSSSGWGETWWQQWIDGEIDVDTQTHQQIQEGIMESRGMLYEQSFYTELARIFGLDDVANDIQAGKYENIQDWQEKNCQEGYQAFLSGKKTHRFDAESLGLWDGTISVYTCDINPCDAAWIGDWDWNYRLDTTEWEHRDTIAGITQFSTRGCSASGFNVLNSLARARVSDANIAITVSINLPVFNEVEFKGKITKGTEECKKSSEGVEKSF